MLEAIFGINYLEEGKKYLREKKKIEEAEKQEPYCSAIGGKCLSCEIYNSCPTYISLKF
jgi:hypothetical protein